MARYAQQYWYCSMAVSRLLNACCTWTTPRLMCSPVHGTLVVVVVVAAVMMMLLV